MENLKRILTTKFIFKFISQIKSGEDGLSVIVVRANETR